MGTPLALYMGALVENIPIKDVTIVADGCPSVPESHAKSSYFNKSYASFSSSIPELSRWDSTPISPDLTSHKALHHSFPAYPQRTHSFDDFDMEPSDDEEETNDNSEPLLPLLSDLSLHSDACFHSQSEHLPPTTTKPTLLSRHSRHTSLDTYSLQLAKKMHKNSLPPKVPVRKPSIHDKGSNHSHSASSDDDDYQQELSLEVDDYNLDSDSDSDGADSDLEFASDTTPPRREWLFGATSINNNVRPNHYTLSTTSLYGQDSYQIPETKLAPTGLLRRRQQDATTSGSGSSLFDLGTYLDQQQQGNNNTNDLKHCCDDASLSEKATAGPSLLREREEERPALRSKHALQA